jgi:FSR family fosmidomycin resistance protein-like MFS transporter
MDAYKAEGAVLSADANTPTTDLGAPAIAPAQTRSETTYWILAGLCLSHLLNDLVQSLVPAIYPLLKQNFALDFGQIGLITLTFQLTSSLLQPVVGYYTDKRPSPFSLTVGMTCSLLGIVLLASAWSYAVLLVAAGVVGLGSSVFHPESSRMARAASGGRYGLAQSVFQVGGNTGQALGPLLAAFIVVPNGQRSVLWFSVAAGAGIVVLTWVGRWYRARLASAGRRGAKATGASYTLPRTRIVVTITILIMLIFSKFFYMASFNSYYTFYLIDRFGVSVQTSQLCLFVFLGSVATGTLVGGPIGDRVGRKAVIWGSILGVLPFTLALPYVNFPITVALTVPIGMILASAMPAILVYAQELLPGRVGLVGGLFFGLSFGMGGLGAALLGQVADHTSIGLVYRLCAFLPAIGLLAAFLPRLYPADWVP